MSFTVTSFAVQATSSFRHSSAVAVSLSLSFFASGAGAWVLFTVPEASIIGGPAALAGYTLSTLVPIAIFGWIGPIMRKHLPFGCTFSDYVQLRYGSLVNVYCTLVSQIGRASCRERV